MGDYTSLIHILHSSQRHTRRPVARQFTLVHVFPVVPDQSVGTLGFRVLGAVTRCQRRKLAHVQVMLEVGLTLVLLQLLLQTGQRAALTGARLLMTACQSLSLTMRSQSSTTGTNTSHTRTTETRSRGRGRVTAIGVVDVG